jgi:hypothetical protein
MKFLSVALAALVGFSEAKKTSISGKDLKNRMKKGQFNKQSLMRGAKPHGNTARKLDEEEWEINGLYSVQFNSCLSLTVQDEDLIDEDYITMASAGQIVAEKSYILFDVCLTDSDCYYQADDSKLTFITDIASFFSAFYNFLPNQVEQYCEGCEENEDYCYGNIEEEEAEEEEAEEEEEESEEDGEDEEDDGEDRKLSQVVKKRRKLNNDNAVTEYIDCQKCFNLECYAEENENDGDQETYEFEDALAGLEDLSGCSEIEDAGYYAGLICNAEGTGVEVGVFVDDECMLYYNQKSFASIMTYADQQYYSMSQEVVQYMFTNDFSCYQPEVTYTNPYQEEAEEEDEEDNDEEEEYEAPEAAEWCQDLFDGDFEATNMYDCAADADEDQNDDAEDEYDENLDTYSSWYSYQLSEEAMDDEAATCEIIKALETGETYTVYDKENSGVLYNYKQNNNLNQSGGMSGGAVAGVVILVIVAAAAGAALMSKGKSSSDKKAPLINNGSMA